LKRYLKTVENVARAFDWDLTEDPTRNYPGRVFGLFG